MPFGRYWHTVSQRSKCNNILYPHTITARVDYKSHEQVVMLGGECLELRVGREECQPLSKQGPTHITIINMVCISLRNTKRDQWMVNTRK